MKKYTTALLTLLAIVSFVACKKDKDPDPAPATKTKTEHLTASAWTLQNVTYGASNSPAMSLIPACYKDNTALFAAASTTAVSGTGTVDEKTNVCGGASQTTPFTWTLDTGETVLTMSAALLPIGNGTFNLVTLNATNLVVTQQMTLPVLGSQLVTVTFIH